jgi:hypothetical protein
MSALQITPRYDLQKGGIHITYEKTHSVDGDSYHTVETDSAGDEDALDCVFATFELQGSNRTTVSQKIVTEDWPADLNDEAWWLARVAWLNVPNIAPAELTISGAAKDANIASGTTYPRILIEGTVQDWMARSSLAGYLRAKATYTWRDGAAGPIVEVKVDVPIAVKLMCTSADTKTYHGTSSFDSGEATPAGVAAALYSAWSTLHFDGSLLLTENECSGLIRPSMALRISGGRTEWATMDAVVQQIEEDIDAGQTSVTFGPPARIEADTLVALVRALRGRRFSYNRTARTTGQASGANDVELGGKNLGAADSSGGGRKKRDVIWDTVSSDLQTVDLNPSTVAFADGGDKAAKTLQPREMIIPVLQGGTLVGKRCQILCSDAYHTPLHLSFNFPWRFTQTSDTGGVISAGAVYIGGVLKTVSGLPTDLSGVTTTTKYWIAIDFSAAATATWGSGAALPDNTSTIEYWHVLTLTCAASVITAIFQPWPADIHALLNP